MLKVVHKLLYDPAIFISFCVSVSAALFKYFSGSAVTFEDVVLILSPLGSSLAVSPFTITKEKYRRGKSAK